MFHPFERMVAFRYLRARKQEGFVSVIAGFSFTGIMLGVATLIIVMSVMNGFRQELIGRILGLNGHLNVVAQSGPLYYYDDIAAQVRKTAGVEAVNPVIEGQALLSLDGAASGVIIRGLEPADFLVKFRDQIEAGRADIYGDTRIAIGVKMAQRLNLAPGDKVTLIAPKGKPGPFGTVPRSRSYEIAVIYDVGMFEYNSGFVFMPLSAAQKFFSIPGGVTSLEVFVQKPDRPEIAKAAVANQIKGQARVYDWRDANSTFVGALEVERNVMFIILTLIILVAAFNIISSMIMLVKDKSRDIAIMRTMGASSGAMLRIFILTGASIGLAGTAVGAVLGIAFAENIESIRQVLEGLTGTELFSDEIYFLSKLPASTDWREVSAVIAMAVVLSFGATLYPAWRAARLDPVEALRYE